jgi:hypothetical protein
LIVAALGAVVYANSLSNGFAYDDVSIIVENESIQSWERLRSAIFAPYWPIVGGAELALWRPVTTGLFGLQYLVADGSPVPFHLVNVLLHAAASGALVLLLAHLTSVAAAWVAGLVFAVHPVHTEAVANVVGQAELMAALAALLALLVHARGGHRSTWGTALGVGALYAVGFGAKESAITLLGLVFLMDAARERLGFAELPGYLARRWRTYFVMMIVAVGTLVARAAVLGGQATPRVGAGFQILEEVPRIWTLGEVWTHYVRLWVFPLDLSSDYAPNVIPVSLGWNATNITGVVVVLAVLLGTLAAWRRRPLEPGSRSAKLAAFGVVWFLVAISPISNTLFLTGVMLAERTLYLPSAGLAAAVGWLVVRLSSERPRLAPTLLLVVVVAGSVRTWIRNPEWKSHDTVFTVMARDYPHSGRVQWLLGDNFIDRGRISEGLTSYRAAVDLLDAHHGFLIHVADVLMRIDRYRGADGVLHYAIQQRPDHPLAYGMRSGARAEMGDAEGAERYARAALAVRPTDAIRLHVLAWALAAQGRWAEAGEVRARADQRGIATFWQRWLYDAWQARRRGDPAAMEQALDSAVANARSATGRDALDAVLSRDFGLEGLLLDQGVPVEDGPRAPTDGS